MTAEIAVMNRSGVALAADSAVTINVGDQDKIFNSAHKIFSLSKRHPVGIMIFGNADFMGIPWETIVKTYRVLNINKSFSTVEECSGDFLKFLGSNTLPIGNSEQRDFVLSYVFSMFGGVNTRLIDQVKNHISNSGSIDNSDTKKIISKSIELFQRIIEKFESLDNIPDGYGKLAAKKYKKEIDETFDSVFQKLPFTAQQRRKTKGLISRCFEKISLLSSNSGLVFAGFGDTQILPELVDYRIESKTADIIRYRRDSVTRVDRENHAVIAPFAQREMVQTFMEGIDPDYRRHRDRNLDRMLTEIIDKVVEKISPTATRAQVDGLKSLHKAKAEAIEALLQEFRQYELDKHQIPVLNVVAVLPKDELAEMAESLVNLTSFKRRVSMQAETVGGPIDVAVISKGDGFVWIKRKHYFSAEFNPSFIQTYLSR